MARSKMLYLKSIRSALGSVNSVLDTPDEELTLHEIRGAATQAMQAAGELFKLAGAMDATQDHPGQEPCSS